MDLFVSANVLKIFEKEIENEVSQSFLFYGDKGLGVLYAAKVFARSMLCEKKVLGGCDVCYFCKESLKEWYDEIIILETKEDSIKVEDVKKVSKKLYYKPQYGRKKVLIINEAEKLTTDAQASLLKIIEEPKKDLIIILVSDNKEILLDTILSRVVCVNFFKKNKKDLLVFLEKKVKKNKELISFCVDYFDNMVKDCVDYLENEEMFKQEMKNISEFIKLHNSSFYKASVYIKDITDFEGEISSKENLTRLITSWIRFLKFQVKKEMGVVESDYFVQNNIKIDISLEEMFVLLGALKKTYEAIKKDYLNKRLLLETLFLGRMFKL